MVLKHTFSLIFSLAILISASAQDIHFSQYYHSPLSLNPAMTANFNGMFRVAANHRNQWWQINTQGSVSPYLTYSGSFDMPLMTDRMRSDRFGVGLLLYSDKAGDGALTTQSAMASIAYHKAVDRYGKHTFSLGMQGGVIQKRVFIYDLKFETQLDDFGFNPNIYHGESSFDGKPIIYPDFNAGVNWQSVPLDNFKYYVGFSVFHVAEPKETFLDDEDNKLSRRFSVNGGMEIAMGDFATIAPSMLYMWQANAQQWNVGTAINFDVYDDLAVFAGIWSRINTTNNIDAFIATAGFEWLGFRLGVSYDSNISDLRAATNAQGAVELALIYIYKKSDGPRMSQERYCPSF